MSFEKNLFGVLKSLAADATSSDAFFSAEILDHEYQRFTKAHGARLDSNQSFEVAPDFSGEWRRYAIEQRVTFWAQGKGENATERYDQRDTVIRMIAAFAEKMETDRTVGGSVFDSRVIRGAVKFDAETGTSYWVGTVLVLANEIQQNVEI